MFSGLPIVMTLVAHLAWAVPAGATDLESGARNDRESPWRLRLPAYGHRFFRLSDRKHGRA